MFLVAAAMASCVVGCAATGKRAAGRTAGAVELSVRETRIAVEEPGLILSRSVAVSPRLDAVAYVLKREGALTVVRNGREEATYEKVRGYGMTFSPDGRHLAYVAGKGDKRFMVVDGVAGKEYDDMDRPVWSADSAHLTYTVRRGDKCFAVLDGEEGPPYEWLDPNAPGSLWLLVSPAIGPAGEPIAYPATLGGEFFVVVDHTEGKHYEWLLEPYVVMSADGKHMGYLACEDGLCFAVVDAVEGKHYASVDEGSITLSPEGGHIAYRAFDGEKQFAVVDGVEGPECDSIDDIVFSRDGRNWGYVAKRSGAFAVVTNTGEKSDGYTYAGRPSYSPDGAHMAYAATRGKESFVVRDGVEGEKCEGAGRPIWSTDGRLAYAVQQGGKVAMWVDGGVQEKYDAIAQAAFSPNGEHFAYLAKRGDKWLVVVDAASSREYDGWPVSHGGRVRWDYDYIACDDAGKAHAVFQDEKGFLLVEAEAPQRVPR